jgi:hypothetical protein
MQLDPGFSSGPGSRPYNRTGAGRAASACVSSSIPIPLGRSGGPAVFITLSVGKFVTQETNGTVGTCESAPCRRNKTQGGLTDLLLQPTGDPDDYEVVVEGQAVGRIVLLAGAWSWAIDTAFRPGRHPVYGFEPTRDAAMQAFARSWLLKLRKL